MARPLALDLADGTMLEVTPDHATQQFTVALRTPVGHTPRAEPAWDELNQATVAPTVINTKESPAPSNRASLQIGSSGETTKFTSLELATRTQRTLVKHSHEVEPASSVISGKALHVNIAARRSEEVVQQILRIKPAIDRARLVAEEKPLAKGAFGAVYRCTLKTDVVYPKDDEKPQCVHTKPSGGAAAPEMIVGAGAAAPCEQKFETVAVKIQNSGDLRVEMLASFAQEAAVLSRLSHPHVLGWRGVCVADEGICLVTEFATGGDLAHFLSNINSKVKAGGIEGSPLSRDEVFPRAQRLELLWRITEGIAYLHGVGVVHCDLKPQNILLDGQNRPRIADFGGSYVEGCGRPSRAFTTLYAAPDVLLGGHGSQTGDVFALGCIIWEVWLGSHLFEADPMRTNAFAGMPPAPAGMPPAVATLVRRCIANNSSTPRACHVADGLHLLVVSEPRAAGAELLPEQLAALQMVVASPRPWLSEIHALLGGDLLWPHLTRCFETTHTDQLATLTLCNEAANALPPVPAASLLVHFLDETGAPLRAPTQLSGRTRVEAFMAGNVHTADALEQSLGEEEGIRKLHSKEDSMSSWAMEDMEEERFMTKTARKTSVNSFKFEKPKEKRKKKSDSFDDLSEPSTVSSSSTTASITPITLIGNGTAPWLHTALRSRNWPLALVLCARDLGDHRLISECEWSDAYDVTPLHLLAAAVPGEGQEEHVRQLFAIVESLSNSKYNTATRNAFRERPLDVALTRNNPIAMEFLARHTTPDEAREHAGVALAAERGNADALSLLVRFQYPIDVPDKDGFTPLYLACWKGHVEAARVLVGAGADIHRRADGWLPVLAAACEGHADLVDYLLSVPGASANVRTGQHWTLLHLAASGGHDGLLRRLLATKSINPNVQNDVQVTPLFMAAMSGRLSAVIMLLEAGADTEKRRNDELSPLDVATMQGHTEVVRTLLQHGASVSFVTSQGATPLFLAAQVGHLEAVQLFLARGLDPNQKTADGNSPLFIAATRGRAAVVEWLLGHGASVREAYMNKRSPAAAAQAAGHTTIAEMLKAADGKSSDGWRETFTARREHQATSDGRGGGSVSVRVARNSPIGGLAALAVVLAGGWTLPHVHVAIDVEEEAATTTTTKLAAADS